MCLAIPGKITEIYEENGLQMGKINYAGTENSVCLAYVDDALVGKYVLVHAGFAISVLDEEEAKESLSLWDEMIEKAENDENYRIEWNSSQGEESQKSKVESRKQEPE